MRRTELLESEKEIKADTPRPEDVYERFHIKKELLRKYALNEKLPDAYRVEINKHFRTGNCEAAHGDCMAIIEGIRESEKRNDIKLKQLPPSDRD